MTKTELRDNLVFLSALKLLGQLTEKGLADLEEAGEVPHRAGTKTPAHAVVRMNRLCTRIAYYPVFLLLFRWCW